MRNVLFLASFCKCFIMIWRWESTCRRQMTLTIVKSERKKSFQWTSFGFAIKWKRRKSHKQLHGSLTKECEEKLHLRLGSSKTGTKEITLADGSSSALKFLDCNRQWPHLWWKFLHHSMTILSRPEGCAERIRSNIYRSFGIVKQERKKVDVVKRGWTAMNSATTGGGDGGGYSFERWIKDIF